jgi:hypothetical protein
LTTGLLPLAQADGSRAEVPQCRNDDATFDVARPEGSLVLPDHT